MEQHDRITGKIKKNKNIFDDLFKKYNFPIKLKKKNDVTKKNIQKKNRYLDIIQKKYIIKSHNLKI